MRYLLCAFLLYSLILCSSITYGQSNDNDVTDPIIKKIEYYGIKQSQDVLYAHFDKTLYTNSENVWFTAYSLSNLKANSYNNAPKFISVILVKESDHSIAMQEKFKMANGIAYGNIFLPDTIAPGNYNFVMYTNRLVNGKPDGTFTQPVTIRNSSGSAFKASLSFVDTANRAEKRILLMVNTENQPLPNAKVSYSVGDKRHPLIFGKVRTDKAGSYVFTIPTNKIIQNENILDVEVSNGKEVKNIRLALPLRVNKASVNFYPEGGNLVNSLVGTVGWEAKNNAGKPLQVSAVLFKNDKPVDTVKTNTYGMGKFRLVPQAGSNYHLKLLYTNFPDSSYALLQALNSGPVISIGNAIADDTLRCRLSSTNPGKFYVIVHNYKRAFFAIPVQLDGTIKIIKIDLSGIPRGLANITILDEQQRPSAERIFFAHYDKRTLVNIQADKQDYHTREKVSLKLKLNAVDGKAVEGAVSVACIQSNRIDLKNSNDIESYLYLKNELGNLPLKEVYMGTGPDDKSYLEDVLLIKGWRRYKWQQLMQTTANDTGVSISSPLYSGYATHFDQPETAPLLLAVSKEGAIPDTILTDNTAKFTIKDEYLLTMQDKKVGMVVLFNPKEEYKVMVNDPYIKINEQLAASLPQENYNTLIAQENSTSAQVLKGFEHARHLKEVVIRAKDDSFLRTMNECGDYVCINNILNCPNHRNEVSNHAPRKNDRYMYYNPSTQAYEKIIYPGCSPVDKNNTNFSGINYAKEFYPSDYSVLSPSEPEYISTLYWNRLCKVNSSGEAVLNFYTSDITGPFKIVVQGVSSKDVVYNVASFNVNKATP